jgi:hypothetical protein
MWGQQRSRLVAAVDRLRAIGAPVSERELDGAWPTITAQTAPPAANAIQSAVTTAVRRGLEHARDDNPSGLVLPSGFTAADWLRNRGAQAVTGIDNTTRRDLGSLLADAAEQGWSHQQTAKAIVAQFDSFTEPRPQRHIANRADLIAVTETATAYEAARQAALERQLAAGQPMQKRWLTVGDERTCNVCNGNAQAGWIAAASLFPSSHVHAPGHPACRCTTMHRRTRS